MKSQYLVILSLILCISLGLSSVGAAIVASDDSNVDEISVDAIQIEDNGVRSIDDAEIDKVGATAAPTPLSTYIETDNSQFPANEKSTVTASVYAKFNDIPTLVKNGTISLYVDGKEVETIDLADCNGKAKFSIPAVPKDTSCKLVYNGAIYQDDEYKFEFLESSKDLSIVAGDESIPTTIKLVPSKISGYDGDIAKISAKVIFNFNEVDSVANAGTLSLLKDGSVIQTADLSKNSNPTFSFKLEKGHKYSLSYSGGNTGGELDLELKPSSTNLDVTVLENTNKTDDNKVDMKNTGAPLAILIIALIGLPFYLRRDK